jgi:hypothetical protein
MRRRPFNVYMNSGEELKDDSDDWLSHNLNARRCEIPDFQKVRFHRVLNYFVLHDALLVTHFVFEESLLS